MSDEIATKIGLYIAKEITKRPEREIKLDEPLLSSGLVDSFSLVDLSLYIQDTFNVLIDDTELNVDSFDTLTDLAKMVKSRM